MTPTEINRRIAEACGLRLVDTPLGQYAAIPEDDRPVFVMSESPIRTWWFDPYHDANDALWAAERVGLFDPVPVIGVGRVSVCKAKSGIWSIWKDDKKTPLLSLSHSFPDAICNAILVLAGKDKE